MPNTPTRLAAALTLTVATALATPAMAGIYIGNPIVIEGITTDSSNLTEASGDLVDVSFEICGKSGAWVEAVGELEDLANGGIAFDVPAAEYCKVTLKFDGDVGFVGDADGGWTQELSDEVFVLEPNSGETAFELVLTEISAADVKLVAAD